MDSWQFVYLTPRVRLINAEILTSETVVSSRDNAEAEVESEVKSASTRYSTASANRCNGFSASYPDGRREFYRKLGRCRMSNMFMHVRGKKHSFVKVLASAGTIAGALE